MVGVTERPVGNAKARVASPAVDVSGAEVPTAVPPPGTVAVSGAAEAAYQPVAPTLKTPPAPGTPATFATEAGTALPLGVTAPVGEPPGAETTPAATLDTNRVVPAPVVPEVAVPGAPAGKDAVRTRAAVAPDLHAASADRPGITARVRVDGAPAASTTAAEQTPHAADPDNTQLLAEAFAAFAKADVTPVPAQQIPPAAPVEPLVATVAIAAVEPPQIKAATSNGAGDAEPAGIQEPPVSATADEIRAQAGAAGMGGSGRGGVDRTADGAADEPWDGRAAAAAILSDETVDALNASEERLMTAHSLANSVRPSEKAPSKTSEPDFSFMGDQAEAVQQVTQAGKGKLLKEARERLGQNHWKVTIVPAEIQEVAAQAIGGMEAKITAISEQVDRMKARLQGQESLNITQLSELYDELTACLMQAPNRATQLALVSFYNRTTARISELMALNRAPKLPIMQGAISNVDNPTELVDQMAERLKRVEVGIPRSISELRIQEAEVHALLQQAAGRLGAAEFAQLKALFLQSFATVEADVLQADSADVPENARQQRASAAGRYLLETYGMARANALGLGALHAAEVRSQETEENSLDQLTRRLSALGPSQPDEREAAQPVDEPGDRLSIPDFTIGFDASSVLTQEKLAQINQAVEARIQQVPPEVISILGEDRVRELETLPLILAGVIEVYKQADPFHTETPFGTEQTARLDVEVDHALQLATFNREPNPTLIAQIRALAASYAAINASPNRVNSVPNVLLRLQKTQELLTQITSRLPDNLKAIMTSVMAHDLKEKPEGISDDELRALIEPSIHAKEAILAEVDLRMQEGEQPFSEPPALTLADLQMAAEVLPTLALLKHVTSRLIKEDDLYSADIVLTSLLLSPEEQARLNALTDETRAGTYSSFFRHSGKGAERLRIGFTEALANADDATITFAEILEGIKHKGETDPDVLAAHREGVRDRSDINKVLDAMITSYIDLKTNGTLLGTLLTEGLYQYAPQPRNALLRNIYTVRRNLAQAAREAISTEDRKRPITDEERDRLAAIAGVELYLIGKLDTLRPLEKAIDIKLTEEDRKARNVLRQREIAQYLRSLEEHRERAERQGPQASDEVKKLARDARSALAPKFDSKKEPEAAAMLNVLNTQKDRNTQRDILELSGFERWLLVRLASGEAGITDIAKKLTAISEATTRFLLGDEQITALRHFEDTQSSYKAIAALATKVQTTVGADAITYTSVKEVLSGLVDKLDRMQRNELIILLGGAGAHNAAKRETIAQKLTQGLASVKDYLATGRVDTGLPLAEFHPGDRPERLRQGDERQAAAIGTVKADQDPGTQTASAESTQVFPPEGNLGGTQAAQASEALMGNQDAQAIINMLSGNFGDEADVQNLLFTYLSEAANNTLTRPEIAILTAIATATPTEPFDADAFIHSVNSLVQTSGEPGTHGAIAQFMQGHRSAAEAFYAALDRLVSLDEAARSQVAGILAANGFNVGQVMGEIEDLHTMLEPLPQPQKPAGMQGDTTLANADNDPDAGGGATAAAQAGSGTTETLNATVAGQEISANAEQVRALNADITFVDTMLAGGRDIQPTSETPAELDIPRLSNALSYIYADAAGTPLLRQEEAGLLVALFVGGQGYFDRIHATLERIQADQPDEAVRYLQLVGGAHTPFYSVRQTDLRELAINVMAHLTQRTLFKDFANIFTNEQSLAMERILSEYIMPGKGTLSVITNGANGRQTDEDLQTETITYDEAARRARAEGHLPSDEVPSPGADLVFFDESEIAATQAGPEVTTEGGKALLQELRALEDAETIPLTVTDAAKLKKLIDNPDSVTIPQILDLTLLGNNVDALNAVLEADRLDFNPLKEMLTDYMDRPWGKGEEFRRLPVDALLQDDLRQLAEVMKTQHDRRETARSRERGTRAKPGFDTSRMLWILMLGQQPGWEVYQPKDSLLSGHFVVAVGPHKRNRSDTSETLIVMEAGVKEHATYATLARLLPSTWDFVTRRVGKKEFRDRGWGFKLNHWLDDMATHHEKFMGLVGRVRGIIDRHTGAPIQAGGTSPLASVGAIVDVQPQGKPGKARPAAERRTESKPTRQPELSVAEEQALIASLRPVQLPRPGEHREDASEQALARRVEAYEQERFNELSPYLTVAEIGEPELVADEERRREHFPEAELTDGDMDFLQLFVQMRAHAQDPQSLEGRSLQTAQALGKKWNNFVLQHGQQGEVLERIDQVLALNEQYTQLLQHGQNLAINVNSTRLETFLNAINHPLGMDSFGIPIDTRIKDLLREVREKMRAAGIDTTRFY